MGLRVHPPAPLVLHLRGEMGWLCFQVGILSLQVPAYSPYSGVLYSRGCCIFRGLLAGGTPS